MQSTRTKRHFLHRLLPALLATVLLAGLPLSAAEPTKSIASALQPFVDSHTLAGAVTLVASKEKILSLEAVGWADIAASRPMKTDALFWIASQSKPVTATALMMLADEGKVNVDDPVEKYLPEFKGQWLAVEQDKEQVLLKKPASSITVKDILSHTSGLPFSSRLERKGDALKIDRLSLREAVFSYALTPLNFEPGTKYDYSNAGINTAGRIIEVVSGTPYEEFMARRLFKPLGMTDTTLWPSQKQIRRLAKSYKPNADKNGLEETPIDQLSYPLTDPKRGPSPAGGFFSTATDLSIFCRMILNGGVYRGKRYLSEAAVKQMTSTQTRDLPQAYGFGWATDKKPGSSFGHGGAYSTNMQIDPQRQLITIFMVQHAGYPGTDGGRIQPTFTKAAVEVFGKYLMTGH
jgi:CubicO group peptidase (beta-lactamase class C family)